MEKETTKQLLSRLGEMASKGLPWHELGMALRGRPELAHRQSRTELLVAAGKITGLAPLMLSRYLQLLDKLHSIAGSSAEISQLLPPRFTAGELAVRLYERNPAEGLRALKDLRARKMTTDEVRKELANQPSTSEHAHSRLERALAIKTVEAALPSGLREVFGYIHRIARRPSIPTLSPIAYDLHTIQGERIGIDVYLPVFTVNSSRTPLDQITKSVVLSPYFEEFYLLFGPGFRDLDIQRAEELLNAFHDGKPVGILFMPDGTTIRQRRAATRRLGPGYSNLYADLVKALQSATHRDAGPDETADERDPVEPRPGI